MTVNPSAVSAYDVDQPIIEEPSNSVVSASFKVPYHLGGFQIQNKENTGIHIHPNNNIPTAIIAYSPLKNPDAWAIMKSFVHGNETIPEIEQKLEHLLGDRYAFGDWKAVFDAILEAEDDIAAALDIIALQEANAMGQPHPVTGGAPSIARITNNFNSVDHLRGLNDQDDAWNIVALSGCNKSQDAQYPLRIEVDLIESLNYNHPFPDFLLQLACILSQHVANQVPLLSALLPFCQKFMDAIEPSSTWNDLFGEVPINTLVKMNLGWHRRLAKYGLEHVRQFAKDSGDNSSSHLDEQAMRGAVNLVFGPLSCQPGVDHIRIMADLKVRLNSEQGTLFLRVLTLELHTDDDYTPKLAIPKPAASMSSCIFATTDGSVSQDNTSSPNNLNSIIYNDATKESISQPAASPEDAYIPLLQDAETATVDLTGNDMLQPIISVGREPYDSNVDIPENDLNYNDPVVPHKTSFVSDGTSAEPSEDLEC